MVPPLVVDDYVGPLHLVPRSELPLGCLDSCQVDGFCLDADSNFCLDGAERYALCRCVHLKIKACENALINYFWLPSRFAEWLRVKQKGLKFESNTYLWQSILTMLPWKYRLDVPLRQGTHFELPMATTWRAQRPKDWHPKIEELGAASQRVGFGMVGVLEMAT